MPKKTNIFWFRRDLRLDDNTGFSKALKRDFPVMPIFIFDKNILEELPEDDARVTFIYETLQKMRKELQEKAGSSIALYHGKPVEIFKKLAKEHDIKKVFANRDYEPYALERDEKIKKLLKGKDIEFHTFKDQVIFEQGEIHKKNGGPYTVYTPYMKAWKKKLNPKKDFKTSRPESNFDNLVQNSQLPNLELSEVGFKKSNLKVPDFKLTKKLLKEYESKRDFPTEEATSRVGPHLRFGTISIRKLANHANDVNNKTYLEELIWREFFMQVLFHFPKTPTENFHKKYDGIKWKNNKADFEKWKTGTTGFPMVDAGMRQLNESGYMHNRMRMVVASFLCKDLLIDWRWGEAYFAEKLLDYEMSSNVGNWQWAAGTGVDAVPYFRVFNPETQREKFDPDSRYVKKWVEEFGTDKYPEKMLDHKEARKKAIETYKKVLSEKT